MLNEDKLKLMAGIAMFEKREGKRIFPVNRYFCSDYISKNMLRSFFSYSFCYLLCVGVWILCNTEMFLNTVNVEDLISIGKNTGAYYLTGLVIYQLITFIVYWKRYEYARRGMKVYVAKLKRLEKRYEFQSRTRELTKEGGRRDGATRV